MIQNHTIKEEGHLKEKFTLLLQLEIIDMEILNIVINKKIDFCNQT